MNIDYLGLSLNLAEPGFTLLC